MPSFDKFTMSLHSHLFNEKYCNKKVYEIMPEIKDIQKSAYKTGLISGLSYGFFAGIITISFILFCK